jgi:hypothetical protein
LPDHEKWLDALEAGADDYSCMPLDRQQLRWLFRQKTPARACVVGAS